MAAVFQPKSFPMPPVIPPSTGTPATGFPEVVFLQLSLIVSYVENSSQTQKPETIETIYLLFPLKLFNIKIRNL